MNIMILSDQESKLLYEYYDPERIKDIDLLISCGDLPPEYLTFFASVCHAPLVYVRGNLTINTPISRRRAVSALRTIFMCIRESGSWGWEVLWNIFRARPTSTQSARCGPRPKAEMEASLAQRL